MKCRFLEVFVLCCVLALKATAQVPYIFTQPQSITVNNASTATFSVVEINASSYQWQLNGTNLPGETNSVLTLDDVSSNQAGSYTVVLTSSGDQSVTSAPAVLTIVPGTIIRWTISTYPNGSSSNFLVQLFDHDKPATVENFIHYITAGAYSNMFVDRDVAGFVLQGGDDVATDRTANSLNITPISPGPSFPAQVASEFYVGPMIPNTFGTLAMALRANEPDSATSAFFFNLTDNSEYLDTNSGGFTVFGRILYGTNSGSNVLQYFNTLSTPASGIYDYSSSIPTLPVNYDGTNAPTDANLFFCDFAFVSPSSAPVDTNPPTVAIEFPTPNLVFDNTNPLTVTGTASDDVGLADVFIILTPETGGSAGISQTNIAEGTTNWSVDLGNIESGTYQLTAYAQDGAGNLSLPMTEYFTSSNDLPPVILDQPVSLTNVAGSTAEFSVTASNAASYQWQLISSGPISGATSSTLVLTNLNTNQSGTSYEVVVTAANGETVTSSPAVLTVVAGTLVQITIEGFPGGYSSNIVVELFDQEKPVTVANFLHYVVPASYYYGFEYYEGFNNMVWDKCIPGFILQGGDYFAADQTNTIPPLDIGSTLYSIDRYITQSAYFTPYFASQVDSEFSTGPLLHNTFGTLAMAFTPGDSNSAASSFFFNLADNSAKLDPQGYTVFGRVVSGSNVLQYFNTLSKPNQGIFDSTTVSTDQTLPDLPVNYRGWGLPANSNLFIGKFTVLSTVSAETSAPTVVVTSLTNGQTLTNSDLTLQGTASDAVGVANVVCFCNGSNYSSSLYAAGTTNWTVSFGDLLPGEYTNMVYVQNGAGVYSSPASNVVVMPRLPFKASVTGNGTATTNWNGTNTTLGGDYKISATAGKGAVFVDWVAGNNAFLEPSLYFPMPNGLQITANFITNTSPGVTVTHPTANQMLTSSNFSLTGKLAGSFGPAQISWQVFSAANDSSYAPPLVLNATNTNSWSTSEMPLAPGSYIAQVIATNAHGKTSLATIPFTILAQLNVTIYGPGKTSLTNGSFFQVGTYHTITATPDPGQQFVSFDTGAGTSLVPWHSFYMSNGLAFTATFVSNSLSGNFSLKVPAANAILTTSVLNLNGKILSANAPQVACQLFSNSVPVTGFMQAVISGTNWQVLVTNLPMGSYTAVALASDATGKSELATGNFVWNFFPSLAGTYHGIFFNTNALAVTNAGYVSFVFTSTGVVDGALTFPTKTNLLNFSMGHSTSVTQALPSALDLTLNFDATNFSGQLTGLVTQGGESCSLTAYRAVTKLSTNTVPSTGQYVLTLEPETTNGPAGDGFASVAVAANGNLAIAGTLADDTSFSQSTGVFTNGVWPLYANLNKSHGMVIGWETNLPEGGASGTLYWIKSRTNGLYYTNNAVNEQLNSVGAKLTPPTASAPYQIVFGGGTLESNVTILFSFNKAGTFVPAAGAPDKLKGSLVLSTGVLSGSIVNPINGKTLPFSGVFISPLEGGSGFTLDANSQTGYFEIKPVLVY